MRPAAKPRLFVEAAATNMNRMGIPCWQMTALAPYLGKLEAWAVGQNAEELSL